MKKSFIALLLTSMVSMASIADPSDPPHVPFNPHRPTVPDEPNIIQVVPGQECDEYQIIITSVRGNQGLDSEVIGYCDRDKAVATINSINSNAYTLVPKGRPVYRIANPLF